MAKTRVHELAKELGYNSKDLLDKIIAMGIDCKSHMAALEDEDVATIRKNLAGGEKKKVIVEKASERKAKEAKEEPKAKAPAKPMVIVERKADREAAAKKEAEEKQAAIEKKEKEKKEAEIKKEEERKAAFEAKKEAERRTFDRPREERRNFDRPQRDRDDRRDNRDSNGERREFNRDRNFNGERREFNKDRSFNGERKEFNKDRNFNGERKFDKPKFDKPMDKDFSNNRNDNRRNNFSKKDSFDNEEPQEIKKSGNRFDEKKKFEEKRREQREKEDRYDKKNSKHKEKEMAAPAPLRDLSRDAAKKHIKKEKTEEEVVVDEMPIITVPENMTVNEFASKIDKPTAEIIKQLMLMGIFANINQLIGFDTCEKIAELYDILLEKEKEEDVEEILFEEDEATMNAEQENRAPVVVVMGHVDHGKTSLLDAMRSTDVTATEHGGITQHIGASVVEHAGKKITFLDTPGHEAFTAMRLRGAKVTDIAILVVAADDGVMPQTIEAIDHAKVAGIPVIVAVNKIDKPEANPERVKQELAGYGIVSEEWGGENIFVEVSAKAKIGIDNLLDTILLVAEMQDLKARKTGLAKGSVIEARLDKNKGVIATLLVEQGTLHAGEPIFAGESSGNVRVMINDKGRRIKLAEPGTPIEVTGLNKVPSAGDTFYVTRDEKEAREFAEKEEQKNRERKMLASHNVSLDSLFTQIQSGEVKKLNILIKADVQGSAEAVRQSLEKLSNEEVIVNVIRSAAGAITESDVTLAAASNAIIIGFNIRPTGPVIEAADRLKIDIKLYRVIYEAIEEVEAAMKGMLSKKYEEKVLGHAEVRSIFRASAVGTIAGCMVTDGAITKGNKVRLLREGVIVFEGEMAGLKRFKDDVKEAKKGFECGISLVSFNDIRENDVIEAYTMEEVKR